jgi:hypothetical protein
MISQRLDIDVFVWWNLLPRRHDDHQLVEIAWRSKILGRWRARLLVFAKDFHAARTGSRVVNYLEPVASFAD